MESHDYMRRLILQNESNKLSRSVPHSERSGESNMSDTKVTSKSSRLIYKAIM